MKLLDVVAGVMHRQDSGGPYELGDYYPLVERMLSEPQFQADFTRIVTTALVETEEGKIDWSRFDDDDYEINDSIGCGDGETLAHHILTVDAMEVR